ncbi:MAG: NAD(P)/FAD-dependent oxidoreductase [Luteimonas sp.]
MHPRRWDVVIVGAGPAGLSAALYAARFRRTTLVLHDGTARALRAPMAHNVPGYEHGIPGAELIERMHRHASRYGARIEQTGVRRVAREDACFVLTCADGRRIESRTVVLATGVHLGNVPLEGEARQRAIDANALRYCPICDGFEQSGRRVAVYTDREAGVAEALFFQQFTPRILVALAPGTVVSPLCARTIEHAGIQQIANAHVTFDAERPGVTIRSGRDGSAQHVDVLYPSLGSQARSDLAVALGLPVDEAGCVDAQAPSGTAIPGLYCAGDVVAGLDQITIALGHGAQAATSAHNWLREADGDCLPNG